MGLVLPTEIVYHIISYLDHLELVRLQMVSKEFNAIFNDPSIWRPRYKNAHLPRPHGPFPWQSTPFHRRTLLRSARLARTWTSEPFRPISSHEITSSYDLLWVSKRWEITCRDEGKIVSRDLDTESQQTLWDGSSIAAWTACSIISPRGHLIYVILRVGRGDHHDRVILLEFRADDDTGNLSGPTVFDAPITCLREVWTTSPHVIAGDAPFFLISVDRFDRCEHTLIFDTRSLIFYKFPQFETRLEDVQPLLPYPESLIVKSFLFTKTHIIVISNLDLPRGNAQLIQAFMTIENTPRPANEASELRLSHETTLHGCTMDNFHIIRDFGTDSVDGSMGLRFLRPQRSPHLQFICTEITLPQRQIDAVLPISQDTYEVITMENRRGGHGTTDYILSCDNGFARGFVVCGDGFKHVVNKFTIDGTGERCVGIVGDHPSPRSDVWIVDNEANITVDWFDGVKGRICCSWFLPGSKRVSRVVDLE